MSKFEAPPRCPHCGLNWRDAPPMRITTPRADQDTGRITSYDDTDEVRCRRCKSTINLPMEKEEGTNE